MNVYFEGIWCRAKSEYNRYVKKNRCDLAISYSDVFVRLSKNDPEGQYPSKFIVSLQLQKNIRDLILKSNKDKLKIIYMFNSLNYETIKNLKTFLTGFDISLEYNLTIIESIEKPASNISALFDQIYYVKDD